MQKEIMNKLTPDRKYGKPFIEAILEASKRVETFAILHEVQKAIDELRSEETSGNTSDLLLASSRAQAILEHVLTKYGVASND